MSIVLRFFPNGEFSQGVDTSARRDKNAPKRRYPKMPTHKECIDAYMHWAAQPGNADMRLYVPGMQFMDSSGGIYTYLYELHQEHHFCYESDKKLVEDLTFDHAIGVYISNGTLVPLVHQMLESSPVPEKLSRKGLVSMTTSMARNIRNAVYLLEKNYGKDNISFLTLTLPDLEQEGLLACADKWDYMVDQLLKSLRKRIEKRQMKFEYVYCTEIQMKRLKQRHEYAPHIHIVFRGRYGRKSAWAIAPSQVRNAWAGIIANVVGHRRFAKSALENLQRIRKSATRYLSKYLSKGACCLPPASPDGSVFRLRTQWGGMARSIARAVRSCTVRVSSGGAHPGLGISILEGMDKLVSNGIVRFFKRRSIVTGTWQGSGVERVIWVGSGCLATPTYEGGFVKVCRFIDYWDTL